MAYWARTPQARGQQILFSTTLDDVIPPDHPVRLIGELLDGFDWTMWEGEYHGSRGKPPIHPRVLAGLWLYGLRRGVRSSRKLEYMSRHSVDFLWLAEGHSPDHSTLSHFRLQFGDALKELFRHVLRVAMAAGLLRLVDVATDGTRAKASNSRSETWTAKEIGTVIDQLVKEFETKLSETRENDGRETDLFGDSSTEMLPPELADLKLRREKLEQIQRDLKSMDEDRRKNGVDPAKNPAQIPKTDPDSRILPNKEGGYAPNYTPICTAEGHGGFLVDADVVSDVEQRELLPSLDRVQQTLGEKPENALADGAFATGPNIEGVEQRGIEFFSNLPSPDTVTNPALRADPTQPVPADQWDQLPINPQTKKLDKACFVYVPESDTFHCPQGHAMPHEEKKSHMVRGEKVAWSVYRCDTCEGCPLKPRCVGPNNKGGRTVRRDTFAPQREQFAAKMRAEPAQKKYDQRMRIAETPFALIKHVLGLRQFLLRGLDKVKLEWMWTCTAINLDKLARGMARLRTQFEAEAMK
jgi:transposase